MALLFALVNDRISCTLLGMANKGQVDVALNVVKRIGKAFHLKDGGNSDVDIGNDVEDMRGGNINARCSSEQDENRRRMGKKMRYDLESILTFEEKSVLNVFLDETNGPFADLLNTGKYEWDGIKEADNFWLAVSGGKSSEKAKSEAAERMRRNKLQ